MESFFEAWVETVLRRVVPKVGGLLKTGRKRETVFPLSWEPPYLGSQRSLVPDLILQLERITIIVDAKYKRHWEELQHRSWHKQADELREEHRADLFQVLAYANLAHTSDVICCLVYPCSKGNWESLVERGRVFHKSELPDRGRRVRVWLAAMPMEADTERVAAEFARQLRSALVDQQGT
jgi:5-methylcytosine-specific restriction endonuclease McrBC regulatory subunit McrC